MILPAVAIPVAQINYLFIQILWREPFDTDSFYWMDRRIVTVQLIGAWVID
jgi:hypothetical protein